MWINISQGSGVCKRLCDYLKGGRGWGHTGYKCWDIRIQINEGTVVTPASLRSRFSGIGASISFFFLQLNKTPRTWVAETDPVSSTPDSLKSALWLNLYSSYFCLLLAEITGMYYPCPVYLGPETELIAFCTLGIQLMACATQQSLCSWATFTLQLLTPHWTFHRLPHQSHLVLDFHPGSFGSWLLLEMTFHLLDGIHKPLSLYSVSSFWILVSQI